jgi:large subunit ribosomal protein L25
MDDMDKFLIKAEERAVVGKKVKALRREGMLPAVIYGSELDPLPITLDTKEMRQTLALIGANTLVTVKVGKKEHLALVRDLQREVISRNLLHVDFQAVSLEEMISTTVPIAIEGEAPAVSEYNALLVTELEELEIEAKAKDLPDMIVVDVTGLTEIGDNILISDLVVTGDIKILNDPDEIVVVVATPTVLELEIEEEVDEELLEELPEAELLEGEEADELGEELEELPDTE